MKKIVLSIFGIFALTACGGDVYQEDDKQFANNPQNSSGDSSGIPFILSTRHCPDILFRVK